MLTLRIEISVMIAMKVFCWFSVCVFKLSTALINRPNLGSFRYTVTIGISYCCDLPRGTTMENTATKLDLELFESSFDGDIEGVRAALAQGGRVTVRNSQGFTPLFVAAQEGHTAMCGLFELRLTGEKIPVNSSM